MVSSCGCADKGLVGAVSCLVLLYSLPVFACCPCRYIVGCSHARDELHVGSGSGCAGKAVASSGVAGKPITLSDLAMGRRSIQCCQDLKWHVDCNCNLPGGIEEQTLVIDGSGETWTYHYDDAGRLEMAERDGVTESMSTTTTATASNTPARMACSRWPTTTNRTACYMAPAYS